MRAIKSFLSLAVIASVIGASAPSLAGDNSQEASGFVQSIATETFGIIKDGALDKNAKQKKLEQIFAKSVDIPWVGKFVLGRFWKQANEAQRAAYLKEYEAFIISHYSSRFAQYSGGEFKITGSRADAPDQYTVSMEISPPKDDTTVLADYRVHKVDGGYKVFDVIVEGVSMITTQRSEFNSILSQGGIDELTKKLANKTVKVAETAAK